MDGGRRLLRSLKEAIASPLPQRAAFAGAADLRHGYDPEPPAPVRSRRRRKSELPGRLLALCTRRGAGAAMVATLFGAVFVYGALKGGAYEDFVARNGEIHDVIARGMGFGLDVITISGQREITPQEVLAVAGVGERNSLPFLDVRDVRERIKSAPLVREASVRKLYPDRLVIDIVERDAHALWQKDGEIFVISADGTPIDTIHDERFVNLPFVVGEGANERIAEFQKIVEASGDLRPHIRAGVLVTNRRWNVKLTTGVDVKLPEIGAEAAIASLAKLAKEQKIIDKDLISIDMRIPGRLVARLDGGSRRRAGRSQETSRPQGSSMSGHSITPRMKPLSARKSAILCVLDVGTSKIACLIARLMPADPSDLLRGRTHACRVLGIGHQRSRGLKSGVVVDMDEAEKAIRLAVDAAERMAGVQVESLIVNLSGGRLGSRSADARRFASAARRSTGHDIAARARSRGRAHRPSRAAPRCTRCRSYVARWRSRHPRSARHDRRRALGRHACRDLPTRAPVRNLELAINRCHLDVETMVATPYAAGLVALVDDEAELGVACVDFGGGTTTMAFFSTAGSCMSTRSPSAASTSRWTSRAACRRRLDDAERLKTLHGACTAAPLRRARFHLGPAGRRRASAQNHLPKSHRCDHPAARRGNPRTGRATGSRLGLRRAPGGAWC